MSGDFLLDVANAFSKHPCTVQQCWSASAAPHVVAMTARALTGEQRRHGVGDQGAINKEIGSNRTGNKKGEDAKENCFLHEIIGPRSTKPRPSASTRRFIIRFIGFPLAFQ